MADQIRFDAEMLLNLIKKEAKISRQIVKQLDVIQNNFAQANCVENTAKSPVEILRSVPGIGDQILSSIAVEVPELLKGELPTIEALRAYSGVRPVTYQSGSKQIVSMRRTRNTNLSNAFYLMAMMVIQKIPKMKSEYRKFRTKGKTHMGTLRRIGSKMLDVIYAMLRDQTLYQEDKLLRQTYAT